MSSRHTFAILAGLLVTSLASLSVAGFGGFQQQAVGGVSVDAQGVVRNSSVDENNALRQLRLKAQTPTPEGLDGKSDLRKVSLKRLAGELKKHFEANKKLPDELLYLGGLQRVTYVFVYPDENDIVLAGPADGWVVDEQGNVCGKTSRSPVMHLEDLLVTFRLADQLAAGRVTCSIDPSQEGMTRLIGWIKAQGGKLKNDPKTTTAAVEDLLGPQNVTFTGIEGSTRMARILFAADFRMKRIAMGLENSPVAGIRSFLEMTPGGDMFPRWWLTTSYESLRKSEDGLAWELRGQGVKAMTESSHFGEDGARGKGAKPNPIAQKWADDMTKHYVDLAARTPIFQDLRNVMDLAIVVALIEKEGLAKKAGVDLAVLASPTSPIAKFNAPVTVPTQASFVRRANKIILSASGGVELRPAAALEKTEVSGALPEIRQKATPQAAIWQWWWN